MLRIGLIAPPWLPVPPPSYGGTEAMVDLLARGLRVAGHEVVLFTTADSTCGVERRWVHTCADPDQMGATIPELGHVVAAYEALDDCDLIHDHTVAGPLWGADHSSAPVVTTLHGALDEDTRRIYQAIDQRVGIVAISHAQRRTAVGLRVVDVVHHGVDPGMFPRGAGDGGYLLFLGRMAPEKGAHRAITVARRARLPLLIAAKMRQPGERAYFEACVRPRLGRDVGYVGEVGADEKVELLASAVALVNPILWEEPFGLVMIEALACGTPVLAFPNGAAPEIVDHARTGFLCADETVMAEAVAVVGTIDRDACRASVEHRFSAKRMVRDYLSVYRRILDCAPETVSRARTTAGGGERPWGRPIRGATIGL